MESQEGKSTKDKNQSLQNLQLLRRISGWNYKRIILLLRVSICNLQITSTQSDERHLLDYSKALNRARSKVDSPLTNGLSYAKPDLIEPWKKTYYLTEHGNAMPAYAVEFQGFRGLSNVHACSLHMMKH
jgi:hypothetical protein